MDVLVVGAGEIGRWIAEVLDEHVTFTDVDPTAAEAAADAVGGRTVGLDTAEQYEAVLLAVPMGSTEAAIERHAGQATDAIVDFAGVMAGPIDAMRTHATGLERASLHPLFAPANAPGRIAIVTEDSGPTIEAIRQALERAGNEIIETTPTEHDRAMETVQASAHAAVLAFALAAEPVPEEFGTPVYDGLRSVCAEVTGGTPRTYADIQTTFDGAVDVADAAARIADADSETFEELYREASNGSGE